jgi:OmpA-OmpF porin, OOP family
MKKKIIALVLLAVPLASQAQFGGLLKKVKEKAEAAVDKATDKIIDNATSAKEGASATPVAANEKQASDNKTRTNLTAYSKFDFVPGEKIIYAEDFSQDAVGEFPLQWTTKARGEVMTLNNQPGKWLRSYKNSMVTSVNKNELGEDYTIEFDLIYYFGAKEQIYVMPDLTVRLLNNYTVDYKNRSGMVSEREGEQSFQFQIHPKEDATLAWIETYSNKTSFTSEKATVSEFSKWYNQPVHYAIQVQKSRVRMWMNEKKVFDLPQAISMDKKVARIAFGLGSTSFDDNQVGYYVTNIRMAAGNADTRHKLLETGTFSTSGILFDVNSDRIKPESFGILNEITKVLTENPTVKIRITGHTSADGNAAINLELSKKRALAVKNFLVKGQVSDSRMETTGLGDTKPVAPNTTKEGRVQNRRVEFTKL